MDSYKCEFNNATDRCWERYGERPAIPRSVRPINV